MRKLILTVLAFLAACGRESFETQPSKAQIFDAAGGIDSPAWDALCKMEKAPPGCDLCDVMGWYSDGTCDSFCASADPDCGGSSCGAVPHAQMTATATSAEPGHDAASVIDGTSATFWHTPWDGTTFEPTQPLPQAITLAFAAAQTVSQLTYTPPDQVNPNGIITQFVVSASTDGTHFTTVARGSWTQDPSPKTVSFTPVLAAYVQLQALAGYGGFAAAGEINISTCVASPTTPTGGTLPLQGNVVHVSGNDSAAINAAVNQASSGDTVFFASGTYSVTSAIPLKSGVLYHAEANVLLENSSGGFAMYGSAVTQVGIDGFTIDHGAGINLENASSAITIVNNTFQNNDLNSFGQVCLFILGGSDYQIHDNTFANVRSALMYYNVSDFVFAHNTVHDSSGNGVSGICDDTQTHTGIVFDANSFDAIGRMGIELIDDVNDPRPLINGMQVTNNTLGDMGLAGGENIAISVVPCRSDGGIVISGNVIASSTGGWGIEVCTPNAVVQGNTSNGPIAIACSPGLQVNGNVITGNESFIKDGGYCGGETVGTNTVNGASVTGSGF
jgi:hypothetical protein